MATGDPGSDNLPEFFLAICKDRPDDSRGFFFTIYFVNNSNRSILEMSGDTSGFASDDEDLIMAPGKRKRFSPVPPHGFIEIEQDDDGAFDFLIQFDFELKTEKGKVLLEFRLSKGAAYDKTTPLSALNREGVVISPEKQESEDSVA